MSVWRGVGNREVPHVFKKNGVARGKHGFPRERESKASVHAAGSGAAAPLARERRPTRTR
jgi:hypothetical protein